MSDYYNIWNCHQNRWINAWVMYDGKAQRQIPSQPFLMSRKIAEWIFWNAGYARDYVNEYEVRPIPQAHVAVLQKQHQAEQERITDQKRRQAHADKYL